MKTHALNTPAFSLCHVKLSGQIRPWDTLACFWDIKQPTNNNLSPCHVKLSGQIRPRDTPACCWDVKQPTNNNISPRPLVGLMVRHPRPERRRPGFRFHFPVGLRPGQVIPVSWPNPRPRPSVLPKMCRETSANMAAGCWSGDQAVGLGRRPLPDSWFCGISRTEDLTCTAVDRWRRRRRRRITPVN